MQVNAVQFQICELCAGNHATQDCQVGNMFNQPAQVNYMNKKFHCGQETPMETHIRIHIILTRGPRIYTLHGAIIVTTTDI